MLTTFADAGCPQSPGRRRVAIDILFQGDGDCTGEAARADLLIRRSSPLTGSRRLSGTDLPVRQYLRLPLPDDDRDSRSMSGHPLTSQLVLGLNTLHGTGMSKSQQGPFAPSHARREHDLMNAVGG